MSGPGGTSATSAADQFTYTPAAPTISESQGFPVSSESIGLSQQAITTASVGDLVVVSIQWHDTVSAVTGITSKLVSGWHRAIQYRGTTDSLTMEIWWGTVTAAGQDTLNISYTSAVSNEYVELIADEFHSSGAASWTLIAAGGHSNPDGNVVNWPRLANGPSSPALYWGASEEESAGQPGSTAGFSYATTGHANLFCYDPGLAANTAYQPSGGSSGSVSTAAGAIFAPIRSGA